MAALECVIGNNHKSDVIADSKHNVAPLAISNPSPLPLSMVLLSPEVF